MRAPIMNMPGTTQGQAHFAMVPTADIPRSAFRRPFNLKTTFDAGYLVPLMVDEVLPGDTYNLRMSAFARLASLIKPLMDNIYFDVHCWFVPMRLIWDNWEKFQGAQDNPGDSTAYTLPVMTPFLNTVGSLFDYMGVPPLSTPTGMISLPARAYNLIWNEWYRDQNLQTSVPVSTGDGPDVLASYTLLRRGKRHDYFTSATTAPQKGTAVSIPLGTAAPVVSTGAAPTFDQITGATPLTNTKLKTAAGLNSTTWGAAATTVGDVAFRVGGVTGLQTDLSTATAATINSLRQAFQIQRIYERDARSGTRYVEALWARWRVKSPDARLQRPEYLGGGTTNINISPVAQTSSTDATTPQANLAALGTAGVNGIGFTKSFPEHGYIIILGSARADLNYAQGLDRMWTRSTRFDFPEPALTHLGEQTILNKEIYYQNAAADNNVFGYQERHAEFRYKPSIATALMRPQVAGTVGNIWTLITNFGALPTLNATFIQDNPDVDRVIAVPSEPHFILDAHFDMRTARALPLYGVPGDIDRF